MSQLLIRYSYVIVICGISSLIAITISLTSIYLQLINYRKPIEQRLIIRIQIMVPLYAVTCFVSLVSTPLSQFIEPVREIYELFVIYTFFELLTVMLGGERNIMFFTQGRDSVSHPLSTVLPLIDISDPNHFVMLKKGILQYVWLKPAICIAILLSQYLGWYDVNDISVTSVYLWCGIVYNLSVTISLYCLAAFWKCLYNDLKPFNPWGKFLCVKLIIFASYWQGVVLLICNYLGWLPRNPLDGTENNIGISLQNLILCVELILFSIGHWYSFSYESFDKRALPNCAKLQLRYLIRDCTGTKDLIIDFKNILNNEFWSYRNFDSSEHISLNDQARIKRINQGMRYSHGGTQKYWLPQSDSPDELIVDDEMDFEIDAKDEKLYRYAKRHYPFGDKNYPVEIEIDSYMYSRNFQKLRNNALLSYGSIV